MTAVSTNTPAVSSAILVADVGLTMSSREIAELTGSTHDNVLKTVRGLVKRGVVFGNETPYVHPQNGQTYQEFNLDYRNTMVVMSGYSAELRARVIDRWIDLERGAAPAAKVKRIRKPAFDTAFRRCLNVASMLPNIDPNQQALMAARGTFELTGVNPLALMGAHAIAAPDQDNYKTPTELGKKFGLSGMSVNQILAEAGLQTKAASSSVRSDWTMTAKGEAYGRMFDTTRQHGKGSQQQLKWKPETVALLRPFATKPEPVS